MRQQHRWFTARLFQVGLRDRLQMRMRVQGPLLGFAVDISVQQNTEQFTVLHNSKLYAQNIITSFKVQQEPAIAEVKVSVISILVHQFKKF